MVSTSKIIIRSHDSNSSALANANERLLLAILSAHDIKVDFAAVAEKMGPQCTKRAVQEQLKKLKKSAVTEQHGTSTPNATPSKVSYEPRSQPSQPQPLTISSSRLKLVLLKLVLLKPALPRSVLRYHLVTVTKDQQTTKATAAAATKAKTANNTKAPAAKKQRTSKAAQKTPKTPNDTEASNVTDEGNLCDDEATPSTNGAANVHNKSALNLAKSLLGAKRKMEDSDDEADKFNTGVKKEQSASENEEDLESDGDGEGEVAEPSNEELWNEVSFGM